MTFHDYTSNRYASVTLTYANKYSNACSVSGTDTEWVDSLFIRLKEVIDSVTPQANWITSHQTLLFNLIALALGVSFFFFISLLYKLAFGNAKPLDPGTPSLLTQLIDALILKYPFLDWLVLAFIAWLLGLSPVFLFRDWVVSLWPTVEFDFGPEHLKLHKLRRTRLSAMFLIIVVPIALNMIYDLLKPVLFK